MTFHERLQKLGVIADTRTAHRQQQLFLVEYCDLDGGQYGQWLSEAHIYNKFPHLR